MSDKYDMGESIPYDYLLKMGGWTNPYQPARKLNSAIQPENFQTVFSQVVGEDSYNSTTVANDAAPVKESYFSRIHKQISDKFDNLFGNEKPQTPMVQEDAGEAQLLRAQLPGRVLSTWMGKDAQQEIAQDLSTQSFSQPKPALSKEQDPLLTGHAEENQLKPQSKSPVSFNRILKEQSMLQARSLAGQPLKEDASALLNPMVKPVISPVNEEAEMENTGEFSDEVMDGLGGVEVKEDVPKVKEAGLTKPQAEKKEPVGENAEETREAQAVNSKDNCSEVKKRDANSNIVEASLQESSAPETPGDAKKEVEDGKDVQPYKKEESTSVEQMSSHGGEHREIKAKKSVHHQENTQENKYQSEEQAFRHTQINESGGKTDREVLRAQAVSALVAGEVGKKEKNSEKEPIINDIKDELEDDRPRGILDRSKFDLRKVNLGANSYGHERRGKTANLQERFGYQSKREKESVVKLVEHKNLPPKAENQEIKTSSSQITLNNAQAPEAQISHFPRKLHQFTSDGRESALTSLVFKADELEAAIKNPVIMQYLVAPQAEKAFNAKAERLVSRKSPSIEEIASAERSKVTDGLNRERGGNGNSGQSKQDDSEIGSKKVSLREKMTEKAKQPQDSVEIEFPGFKPVTVSEPVKHAQELLAQAGIGTVADEHKALILAGVLIKAADPTTFDHCYRVSARAVKTAQKMGVTDPRQLEELRKSALIHDLGKVEISLTALKEPEKKEFAEYLKQLPLDEIKDYEQINNFPVKPLGAFTLNELREIQKRNKSVHTRWGDGLSQVLGGVSDYSKTIRAHHEHYDGMGFPDGLKAENIPLNSRIITVCDYYDAMVKRDGSLNSMGARSHVVHQAGKRFDPAVVSAFLEVLDEKVLQVTQTPALKLQ